MVVITQYLKYLIRYVNRNITLIKVEECMLRSGALSTTSVKTPYTNV